MMMRIIRLKYVQVFIFLILWIGNFGYVNSQPLSGTQPHTQDLSAENMLLWQRNNGGWPKDTYPTFIDDTKRVNYPEPPVPTKKTIDYRVEQSEAQKQLALATKHFEDATIDNNHTVMEIKYLLKVFKSTGNQAYLDAAEKGLHYLVEAQYDNGGWPQFYPDKRLYKHQITFNDNAMANVMNLTPMLPRATSATSPTTTSRCSALRRSRQR